MSGAPWRGCPRWSTGGAPVAVPALTAALPGGSAMVGVGPPFHAGAPRGTSAKIAPVVTAASAWPEPGRVAGHWRLWLPFTGAFSSVHGFQAFPAVLLRNSTLRSVRGALAALRIPAAKHTSQSARFSAMVVFWTVTP